LNSTKNRFFANDNKSKLSGAINKNHNKSLAHETNECNHFDQGYVPFSQLNINFSDFIFRLNFHHQSAVVYSKKPLKSSASGTILPCRNNLMGNNRSGIDQGSRNRKNLSQISSASHVTGIDTIGPQKTKS